MNERKCDYINTTPGGGSGGAFLMTLPDREDLWEGYRISALTNIGVDMENGRPPVPENGIVHHFTATVWYIKFVIAV